MYVEALLELSRSDIVKGLVAGQYRRWGGVVRIARGYPNAGQIVTMLREASPLLQAANPIGAALKSVDMVVNAAGHHVTHKLVRQGFAQTQQMLGQVMGIAAVGTGASVLNLGLTAAGFYVMNKKLNRMQQDVTQLLRLGEDTFSSVEKIDQKIDGVTSRLVELRCFAVSADVQLREILTAVYDVQATLRATQKGQMDAAFRVLADERIDKGEVKKHLHTVGELRLALQHELSGRKLEPFNDPRRFMDTLDAYRLWSLAGMAEIAVERKNGGLDRAAERAEDLAAVGRTWAGQWANDLFPAEEYGGVFRFGHSAFDDRISGESKWRLEYAWKGEDLTSAQARGLESNGAAEVSRHKPGLDEHWFDRQVALAHVLGMIEENTERLESLAWEARYCAEHLLDFRRWEALEGAEKEEDSDVIFDWDHAAASVASR